jgi:hypothetical protein
MGTGVLSPRVRWPKRESGHSVATSAKVKNVDLYIHSPILNFTFYTKYNGEEFIAIEMWVL